MYHEKIVYRDRILYQDKITYQEKLVFQEKIVYHEKIIYMPASRPPSPGPLMLHAMPPLSPASNLDLHVRMPEARLLPLGELSRTNARTCIANTCAHACTHTSSLILSTLTQKDEERRGHLRVKDVRSSQAAAGLGGQGKGGGRGAPSIQLSLVTAGAMLLLMNMGGQLLELLYPALYPAQRPEEPGDGLRDAFCVHAGQSLVRMHLVPSSLTSTPAGMRAARWESFVLLVPGVMLLMSLALRSACSTSLKHVLASTCAAVIALQMAIQVRGLLRALAWCQPVWFLPAACVCCAPARGLWANECVFSRACLCQALVLLDNSLAEYSMFRAAGLLVLLGTFQPKCARPVLACIHASLAAVMRHR